MTTEPHGTEGTPRMENHPESEPGNCSTPATTPPEVSDAIAAIEAKRREYAAERPPSQPKTLASVCEQILAKGERMQPTEAEIAERERQADADREARQRWRLDSAWKAVMQERGPRYESCRFATFDCRHDAQTKALEVVRGFCEQMPDYQRDGRGLVLFGPAGTGKDHLMVASLRVAVFKHRLEPKWVNGMELFGEFRDSIDGGISESEIIARYVRPDILAISDPLPPFGSLTEFQAAMLFRIIDGRYARMLPTWATINIKDGKEGAERFGSQILDRIRHGAVQVACNWPSYREPTK